MNGLQHNIAFFSGLVDYLLYLLLPNPFLIIAPRQRQTQFRFLYLSFTYFGFDNKADFELWTLNYTEGSSSRSKSLCWFQQNPLKVNNRCYFRPVRRATCCHSADTTHFLSSIVHVVEGIDSPNKLLCVISFLFTSPTLVSSWYMYMDIDVFNS